MPLLIIACLGFFALLLKIISHLLYVESFIIGVGCGLLLIDYTHWHPVYGIIVGVIAFAIMLSVLTTKIGFWILAPAFSLGWSVIAYLMTFENTHQDKTWAVFAAVITFIVSMGFHYEDHINRRERNEMTSI
ncbi:hypothetical protein [Arcanobacterium bovis]|uniref:Uncharacterized protein n=1 Tax=Arcanobacterium bovis TaxID=2529275 RepID=A0A4Q9UYJ7_9ACTO|nr:hypothetical protein [Arcanobacterium bovis]TBW20718.1 hypothetical protein EZJ44_08485 [Arcanobacterium bovis]